MKRVPATASFTVGPSRVVAALPRYVSDAYRSGLLSVNHRSQAFAELWQTTKALLHDKLEIPTDYSIVCCGSATECWEIIAQSFTQKGSYHLFSGYFAEKWAATVEALHKSSGSFAFSVQRPCPVNEIRLPEADVLACTQNETSNGSCLSTQVLEQLCARCREEGLLLAADLTSSLGALCLPWKLLDLGFASVQKGLGLPAGLALLVASPRAIAQAAALQERAHYNSYLRIAAAYGACQAPYTPNVLGIYLLMRSLSDRAPLSRLSARTRRRAESWHAFLLEKGYELFIRLPVLRSQTVIVIKEHCAELKKLRDELAEVGLPVSPGYGKWKESSLRLANFPAILPREIAALQKFLKERLKVT